MSQITVKDSAGADQIVAAVDDTGTAAAADSMPVTLSTEDKAVVAAIATEVTLAAMNAKVPALGQALAAASVPVILPAATVTALTPPAAITGFATETTAAAAAASLSVLDDWDESDRAKVNPIVGQAGVAAGAGAVGATVQRVTLASDDPAVSRLSPPSTGTQTSVASGTGDATILASNASRKGAVIFNDDANDLLLLLASGTSSSTNYSVRVAGGAGYELSVCQGGVYTGVIKGLWLADGSGSARVTEFT